MHQSDIETLIHCTEIWRFRSAQQQYVAASRPSPVLHLHDVWENPRKIPVVENISESLAASLRVQQFDNTIAGGTLKCECFLGRLKQFNNLFKLSLFKCPSTIPLTLIPSSLSLHLVSWALWTFTYSGSGQSFFYENQERSVPQEKIDT